MGIQNFPSSLQPIIQQGFLQHAFAMPLRSRLAYRGIADRETIPAGIGETLTKTRHGLKASVTTPATPSVNTNLDNGITPSTWSVEQYSITMNMYRDSIDLNTVTNRVGIEDQFITNARVNGEQAARTLDELARNSLFNSYMGGNTRVRVTLGSAGTALSVDDIRGFQYIFGATTPTGIASSVGQSPTQLTISGSNTLSVVVGANTYTLVGATADVSNVSTAPNGTSGVLTFSTNVSTSDGTAGNNVVAANASQVIRPSGRGNTSLLQASDTLTMSNVLDAVALARLNVVPGAGGGEMYNCYLDPKSARQLFSDPDFKQLFQGVGLNAEFTMGRLESPFLGVRFVPTTEAYVQAHPSLSGLYVRRPIVCGQGALIEGQFAGIGAADVNPADSIIDIVDGVAMVTREPLDRLQQIIAQSWYWIGGYTAPSDILTSTATVPTATSAAYKRAIIIEHVG